MKLALDIWNNKTIGKNGKIKHEYGYVDLEHYNKVTKAKKEVE